MIYFDNAATTRVHESVQDVFTQVNTNYFANPNSLHALGVQVNHLLERSREQFANLLNVSKGTIYFTGSGTESNNTAILGSAFAKQGKHIITTQVEHPSVTNTVRFLEKMGYDVTFLPVDECGVVAVDDVKNALRDDTVLVSVMWVNNEVGALQPIAQIATLLEQYPTIHLHVDAVQALEQVLKEGIPERVDLLSLSAHKFHGMRGVGVLYKKLGRVIEPLLHGGNQEHKLRSGTQNTPAIVASAKALREYKENTATTQPIKSALKAYLNTLDKVVVLSSDESANHVLTFAMPGVRGEVMVHALAEKGIYISTTSACSSKVKSDHHTLSAMGVDSKVSQCAVRMSFSKDNTLEEVEQFKVVFNELYARFLKVV
ncbi:cysteine desulfurase [Carnobacteriaceae bacterium zg-ZUI240]|nr:cysteine desulfurase [Carnobacteriaceae bacterium zg-ZUI240]